MGNSHKTKVEICGVDTSELLTLKENEKRELLEAARAGDRDARERLVLGNLRLVLSVIQRFSSRHDNLDDLFQVGCIGLIKAIDNFNTDLNVKFSTYAVPMIIGEVRRYLRDNNSLRVSRGMRDLAYRALQVREDISRREQREAPLEEIAGKLGEDAHAVGEAMEAIVAPVSLYDSVYSDGEDSTYVIDQIAEEENPAENLVEAMALKDALQKLTPRETGIVTRRFYQGKTQMEIAEEIGISQAQVSRLEKGAIDKLRKWMQ